MLNHLRLIDIGPVKDSGMDLAPRLNIITGDNGLGKSLLLDAVWFGLTRSWPYAWPGKGLVPTEESARIQWSSTEDSKTRSFVYDFADGVWKSEEMGGGTPEATLVVYARVDGGFSVSDPVRTGDPYRLPFGHTAWGRSHCFNFSTQEVWEGLTLEGERSANISQGLLRDWLQWALDPASESFRYLENIVASLSPTEPLRALKKWERVFVDDARDIPLLQTSSGNVPIVHASAAIKRMLGLAYILVWTWQEHQVASRLRKVAPLKSMVLLVDELETHLHPQWQRRIAPALLEAARQLDPSIQLQVLATTHSPLVMASIEPGFDQDQDQVFHLRLDDAKRALVEPLPWAKQGDIVNWLVSDTFGLTQGRSMEAERAIEAAEALMRGDAHALPPDLASMELIHAELTRVLAEHDAFWPRWIVARDRGELT